MMAIVMWAILVSAPIEAQVAWWKWPGKRVGSKFRKAKVGKPAPVAIGETLTGEARALSDYTGKPVLLEFWAPWRPNSIASLSRVDTYRLTYSHLVEVVAVCVFTKREKLDAFLKGSDLPVYTLHDRDGSVSNAYGIMGLPMTVLIAENGIVLQKWGGEGKAAEMERDLAAYFAEQERTRREESG